MKKDKNGFISISVIYSFFLVFLLLLVLIMSSYVNNRTELTIYKNDIKKRLAQNDANFLNEYISALKDQSGTHFTNDSPRGLRYESTIPENYILFNNELWRIVGVFETIYDSDNDNIPDKIGRLVKIARNASIGNLSLDYKQSGVGSSTTNNGSIDWTDSQLMMMLNPPEFYKSGYDANGNQIHSDYTMTTGTNTNSIYDGNNILIYKNMGAYWNANMTAYIPAETTTSGFTSTNTTILPTLNSEAQSYIATVKWHLGRTDSKLASTIYKMEQGTDNQENYAYWYGKVGLLYASDYILATNGGSHLRSTCLLRNADNWVDSGWFIFGTYYQTCTDHSWLLYLNSSSGNNGTKTEQWSLTANIASTQYYFANSGIGSKQVQNSAAIRPTVYLRPNVIMAGGTGTSDDPYIIS